MSLKPEENTSNNNEEKSSELDKFLCSFQKYLSSLLNGKKENKIILMCLGVQRFQVNLKIYPRLKKK